MTSAGRRNGFERMRLQEKGIRDSARTAQKGYSPETADLRTDEVFGQHSHRQSASSGRKKAV
jgi:hypothetical protein